jgi:hypothetical protein
MYQQLMEVWQSPVSNLTASTNFNWVYDSGSRRGLEPCSASSILATQTKNGELDEWFKSAPC